MEMEMDHTGSPERFIGTAEVAAFLDKPLSWVYDQAGPLGIPRYKIGAHYRYRLSEVAAWVEGLEWDGEDGLALPDYSLGSV